MNSNELLDPTLPLLEQCHSLEVAIPLRLEMRVSDLNRNCHSTDSQHRYMTLDDEDDKAKAALPSRTRSLRKSSGLQVKDRTSEVWVLSVWDSQKDSMVKVKEVEDEIRPLGVLSTPVDHTDMEGDLHPNSITMILELDPSRLR